LIDYALATLIRTDSYYFIYNNNTAVGTCFITQTQIVNIPGLVAQLLDQCTLVTIIPG
jgi:hypothetical protein